MNQVGNLFTGDAGTRVEPTVPLLLSTDVNVNIDVSVPVNASLPLEEESSVTAQQQQQQQQQQQVPSLTNTSTEPPPLETSSNENIINNDNENDNDNGETTNDSATSKPSTTRGPCSNDNPEWEEETLPCITTEEIFDGVFTTSTTTTTASTSTSATSTTSTIAAATAAPATTTASTTATASDATTTLAAGSATGENETTTSSTVVDDENDNNEDVLTASSLNDEEAQLAHPSFYSCTVSSSADFNTTTSSAGNPNTTSYSPIYLRYNYEIYTPPEANQEDITEILAKFENDLMYGVASSLGLSDCPFPTTTITATSSTATTTSTIITSTASTTSTTTTLDDNIFAATEQAISNNDLNGDESEVMISLMQASFEDLELSNNNNVEDGEDRRGRKRGLRHRNNNYVRRSLRKVEEEEEEEKKDRLLLAKGLIQPRARGSGGDVVAPSSGIVGLSVEPLDIVDTTLLGCTSAVELDIPHKCTPIHGFMSAWMTNEQQQRLRRLAASTSTTERDQEEMLMEIIQNYVQNNQTEYLASDDDVNSTATNRLFHVELVGERDINVGMINPEILARPIPTGNKVTLGDEDGGGFKAGYIGIAAAAALLAMIAIGAVWVRRHKSSRHVREVEDEPEMQVVTSVHDTMIKAPIVESPLSMLDSPSSSEFGKTSWSGDEEEGAFPTVGPSESTLVNRSGSVDLSQVDDEDHDDDSISDDSSLDQDENVPSDNLFGLSPGDRSDLTFDETSPALKPLENVAADNAGAFDTALIVEPKESLPSDNLFGVSPGDRSDLTFDETSPALKPLENVVAENSGAFDTALIVEPKDSSTPLSQSETILASNSGTPATVPIAPPSVPHLVENVSSDFSNDNIGDVVKIESDGDDQSLGSLVSNEEQGNNARNGGADNSEIDAFKSDENQDLNQSSNAVTEKYVDEQKQDETSPKETQNQEESGGLLDDSTAPLENWKVGEGEGPPDIEEESSQGSTLQIV